MTSAGRREALKDACTLVRCRNQLVAAAQANCCSACRGRKPSMPPLVTPGHTGLDSTVHSAVPGMPDLSLKPRLRRVHITGTGSFGMAESTTDIPTSTQTDFLADFAGQFHVLEVSDRKSCLPPDLVPRCYAASQALAHKLLCERSNGIVCPKGSKALRGMH
jgi:hypothetical protein